MASYFYINSDGKRIEFASIINLCETRGMMSFCRADTEDDQKGCKYRIKSDQKHIKRCIHCRKNINNACDSLKAQQNK